MKVHLYLTLACVVALAACSNKAKDAADAGGEAEPAAPVQVSPAERKSITSAITAEAVLYPIRQASIIPKISAPVAKFLVQRGDHVREGQLVAVLESKDLAAAAQESKQLYAQAQASYETATAATMPEDMTKAKTDVQSAQEALDAAQKVYDSRVQLARQGALAQKLVDDAKVALVQAQSTLATAQQHLKSVEGAGRAAQLKSAQAQRDAAKAHYESAAAQLSYAEVRSPISGLVSDRPLNVGEMASAGNALLSIMDISQLVARANVPIEEAAHMRVRMPATISAAGVDLKGKVTVVSPAVDPNTTTVEVWVQASNPHEQLKPGITVQISVDAGKIPDAIVIPAAALLSADDGGDKVMVAGSDNLAHERKVKVGVRAGDDVQISDGLKDGEQVITQGALGLDDKAKIEIAKPGEENAADAKSPGDEKSGNDKGADDKGGDDKK
ncbi:MAG: efflux RND transporter periplasmic adaptor subunit [Acidobacteriaceae bacterium]|nr:efflux RND transporter periplasmic adaptor subunit [Acidobacteriaceae bacterium]